MPLVVFSTGASFDPDSGDVRDGDRVCRLEPQPAALLALLAARPGQLVAHAEIARHVWPDGTHVDFQASVHYAMRQIRQALGDAARAPRVIETLPRRGYRLRAEALALPPPQAPTELRRGWRGRRLAVAAAMLLLLAATVAVVERRPNDHHQRVVAWLSAAHDLVY